MHLHSKWRRILRMALPETLETGLLCSCLFDGFFACVYVLLLLSLRVLFFPRLLISFFLNPASNFCKVVYFFVFLYCLFLFIFSPSFTFRWVTNSYKVICFCFWNNRNGRQVMQNLSSLLAKLEQVAKTSRQRRTLDEMKTNYQKKERLSNLFGFGWPWRRAFSLFLCQPGATSNKHVWLSTKPSKVWTRQREVDCSSWPPWSQVQYIKMPFCVFSW